MTYLARLGRRHHISTIGLSSLLQEIHDIVDDTGELPDAASRARIKRARTANIQIDTPYGKLIQEIEVELTDPTTTIQVPFVHPPAFIWYAMNHCPAFSELLGTRLREQPCSTASRWSIAIYSDEVVLGNQLKGKNKRKVQAVYWTLTPFGVTALSFEHLWFTIGVLRSALVERIKGNMSAYMRLLLRQFVVGTTNLCTTGIFIGSGRNLSLLMAEFGIMIGDEKAIKMCWCCKGSAGLLPCMFCRNVISLKRKDKGVNKKRLVFTPQPGDICVDLSETDVRKLVLHTDATVVTLVGHLRSEATTLSKANFATLQTRLGYNHAPEGLLMDTMLDIKPIATTMWDWMHCMLVSGIFNKEVGLLMSKLAKAKFTTHRQIHEYVCKFVWPKRLRHASGKDVFESRTTLIDDSELKGSASEVRSVYRVLRLYLMDIYPTASDAIKAAITSCYRLCCVLDLLIKISEGKPVSPIELQTAIASHLEGYINVYGRASVIPKHHFMTHIASIYECHKLLLSCWVHERKHKEIKKYERQLNNTSGKWELSIIENIVQEQIMDLCDHDRMPRRGVVFTRPTPAPVGQALAVRSLMRLDSDEPVLLSVEAMFGPSDFCSKGDVIVAKIEGQEHIAQVWFHTLVKDVHVTCIAIWPAAGNNRFTMQQDEVEFIPTSSILQPCIYTVIGDVALVAP
jgi:hypothetical protein